VSRLGAALRGLVRPARLRLIALAALIAGLVGLGWGLGDEPEYRATASAVVVDRGDAAELLGGGTTGEAGPASGARLLELARGREVAELAAGDLGGDVSGADLLARTTFGLDDDGAVLVIRSTAEFPDFAAAAAAAYQGAIVESSSILERRRLNRSAGRLQDRLDGLEPGSEEAVRVESRIGEVEDLLAAGPPLRIGSDAALPADPVSERSTLALAALAALAGALLAALVLVAYGLLRRPPSGERTLAAALEGPVLATFGHEEIASRRGTGVVGLDPVPAAELAALLDRIGVAGDAEAEAQGPRSVAIVDTTPGDGGSSLALALAAAAALRGLAVILVEADQRSPDLGRRLGIAAAPGLSEYLAGEASPKDVMRTVRVVGGAGTGESTSIVAVTAGTEEAGDTAGPPDSQLERLVAQLERAYDLVVFDAPPLLDAQERSAISAAVEASILSARAGEGDADEIAAALRELGGSAPLGSVVLGAEAAESKSAEDQQDRSEAGAEEPAESHSRP
jgi:Mrp family chromosome partitioning ATPase